MDCDNDPNNPPPANPNPSATTIDSLNDDIILEIFLRLPCFTALVRAAFTRRAWRRAVASSPSFRRRFRALHPAPLLGLFFSPFYNGEAHDDPVFPAFTPSRRPDRDLAGVIGAGDFFLTSIQARLGAAPGWDIVDCRGGLVLLDDWFTASYALLNPSSRKIHGFFDIPWAIVNDGYCSLLHDAQLICSDEDPTRFRVVSLAHDDDSMVQAVVFSSATREWSVFPRVQISPIPLSEINLEKGMQDSGSFIYWPFQNRDSFIKLDTTTMEVSVAQLPWQIKNQNDISFVMGETKDARPFVVYVDGFNVGVLVLNSDDGHEEWVLNRLHSLEEQTRRAIGHLPGHIDGLNVVAIRSGYVYLTTAEMYHDPRTPCWFLSLCFDTMEMEKVAMGGSPVKLLPESENVLALLISNHFIEVIVESIFAPPSTKVYFADLVWKLSFGGIAGVSFMAVVEADLVENDGWELHGSGDVALTTGHYHG
ncbi:hypothetical protein EJB05_53538, partial [Eragrostis curvula]